MSNFCQFKTAYLLPESSVLNELIDELGNIIEDKKLPNGWSFIGSDVSGCAGFILLFESYELPLRSDLDRIEIYLRSLS